MTSPATIYGPEVQKVSVDTALEDILYLLKRDGGVFVKGLVSEADVDAAHAECRSKLDSDVEWTGSFFPSMFPDPRCRVECSHLTTNNLEETARATAMLALSPTYAKTQVMNPLYQSVVDHFLTTRTWYWWGSERKESGQSPMSILVLP